MNTEEDLVGYNSDDDYYDNQEKEYYGDGSDDDPMLIFDDITYLRNFYVFRFPRTHLN